jgi:integrase
VQKANHHLALPYTDIPSFIAELRMREGVAARALEFAILTAARSGEVRGTTWSEIDFDVATWTIPAARMKGAREHKVPLSDRAIEILRALPREDGNAFVFIGGRSAGLSTSALDKVLERMDLKDRATVHGMRSSLRDWCSEMTNYSREVAEMALAHTIPSAVQRAYRRGDLFDKRRRLMADWATYCSATPAADADKNVVPMKAVR